MVLNSRMCRLVYYLGDKTKLKNILILPKNSLWNQSNNFSRNKWFNFKKRDHIINIDGCGIGWLINDDFCVYKNIQVPYHDENLANLCNHMESTVICGHLRAVKSPKSCKIIRDNCHPFKYDKILFLHNGLITNFKQNYHKFMNYIDKKFHNCIEGTTDTEHIFYYYLTLLGEKREKEDYLRVFMVMLDKLNMIFNGGIISANILIITPEFTIGSRYVNNDEEPPSLYINQKNGVIISSEPLEEEGYELVEKNRIILVNHRDRSVKMI